MMLDGTRQELRRFITDAFLLGEEAPLADNVSFLEEGIIDSTGVLELIAFLQRRFGIAVENDELTIQNLDSINALVAFVERKRTPK